MICTDCGQTIKPVVALDIDGTLGDYHGHFLEFAAMYLGIGPKDSRREAVYRGKEKFKAWWKEVWEQDDRTWHDIKLAYRQGGMKRSMPVYPDAAGLCRIVRANGAELWLATTRPYLRLDNVDPDTRFWLSLNGIEYDHLMSREDDKYLALAEHVDRKRVVAVLDDLPEMFQQASQVFGWRVPILRKTQYNSAIACEQGFRDLIVASGIIVSRINEWREHYEGTSPRSEVRDKQHRASGSRSS